MLSKRPVHVRLERAVQVICQTDPQNRYKALSFFFPPRPFFCLSTSLRASAAEFKVLGSLPILSFVLKSSRAQSVLD